MVDTLHADFLSILRNDPSQNGDAAVNFQAVSFKAKVLPVDILVFIGDIISPAVQFVADHPIFTFVLVGGIIFGVIIFSGTVPCLITFNAQVAYGISMAWTKFITLAKAGGSYVLNFLPQSMVNSMVNGVTGFSAKIINILRTCYTAFLNTVPYGSNIGNFVNTYFSIAASKFNQLLLLLGSNLPTIMLGAELVAVAKLLTPVAQRSLHMASDSYNENALVYRRWRIANLERIHSLIPKKREERGMIDLTRLQADLYQFQDPRADECIQELQAQLAKLQSDLEIYKCPVCLNTCVDPVRVPLPYTSKVEYYELEVVEETMTANRLIPTTQTPWPFNQAAVDITAKEEIARLTQAIAAIHAQLLPLNV